MSRCLINQRDCGRVAGGPVCPKCGMDERVVYPGQADREAAQELAELRYLRSQVDALEGRPLTPPSAPRTNGFVPLGVATVAVALLSGLWWKSLDSELVRQRDTAAGAGVKQALPAVPAPVADSTSVVVEKGVVKLYFASGKAEVSAEGGKALEQIVEGVGRGKIALVSGFHDPGGDPAKNAELAKQRAMAVAALLKSEGVADDRIELKKPEPMQGDVPAHLARRVEVSLR